MDGVSQQPHSYLLGPPFSWAISRFGMTRWSGSYVVNSADSYIARSLTCDADDAEAAQGLAQGQDAARGRKMNAEPRNMPPTWAPRVTQREIRRLL